MKKYLSIIILLLLTTANLQAVEEKKKYPFFYLSGSRIYFHLSPRATKICRFYSRKLVHYKNYQRKECYDISNKLITLIQKAIQDNPEKKELTFMIFDSLGERITPRITTREGIFQVQTIIYMDNDKSTHLELIDDKNKYYFYKINPAYIYLGN